MFRVRIGCRAHVKVQAEQMNMGVKLCQRLMDESVAAARGNDVVKGAVALHKPAVSRSRILILDLSICGRRLTS